MLQLRAFLEKGILPDALFRQHPLYVSAMLTMMSVEGEIVEIIRKRGKEQ